MQVLFQLVIYKIFKVVETITSDHKELAWIEGFAILVAVLISSLITTVNNY